MESSPDEHDSAHRPRPFRAVALASGLVSAEELDAAQTLARDRRGASDPHAAEPTAPRPFDAATAAVLVEHGKLTPFQAREILAGRTRFRLGQYTVIDEIGRGGMGQVFKAEHALMGRHVAVKVLPRSKANPESEAAFQREMRILGRLDHENLVRAFDAGYDAMVYYLVTEFVPGMDLRKHVRRHGPLSPAAAASVFVQVARGLACAHAQQLVHRDVKPGNILVMDDGRVKLLDLGLAGSTLEAEAMQLGRVVGTMDYIAPEQIRTPDDVGPPADVYSLGCSFYFAVSGEVPFPGGNAKEKMRRHLTESPVPLERLAPHLPKPLCQVVEAMMAKSVADRIGSAEEVIRRLAPWAAERPEPLVGAATRNDRHAGPAGEGPGCSTAGSPSGSSIRVAARAVPAGPIGAIEAIAVRENRRDADAPRRLHAEAIPWRDLVRGVAFLVPPALAGIGFAVVLSLVRGIDPDRFRNLLGPATPSACGWGAFVIMAAAQAVARFGGGHR